MAPEADLHERRLAAPHQLSPFMGVGCREYRSPSNMSLKMYIDLINHKHEFFDLNNITEPDTPLSSGCSA
jgi:hypothetical protein